MKENGRVSSPFYHALVLVATSTLVLGLGSCSSLSVESPMPAIRLSDSVAAALAQSIRAEVSAELDSALVLTLWASDSLLQDPVALDVDDHGRIYVTHTNRRKTSEFDIRQHKYWERASIAFETVEDRRTFLKETLTPESSGDYHKPFDHNNDSIQDWTDLLVESEEVHWLEDRSGDGIADYAQRFATGFQDVVTDVAGGVLAFDGDVYFSVAPDLWKLTDTDGDGVSDERVSLSHGYQVHIGFGGHNMSGVIVGPDGRIYWGIGDIGFNGVDQEGKRWKYPNQGVIVRCNPDGSDFEVFAQGLRNTHEFVFDAYGNLISVDNDGDHPGERERLVYLPQGSDSGWRINWQFGKYRDEDNNKYKVWMDEGLHLPRFEGQAAYITPCIQNYINGPTGMVFNPGTALGSSWKDHFFVVGFSGNPARSGIYAFTLAPDGAGFKMQRDRKILGGVLATGLDVGADGALYFADWINGWERKDYGRIWKIDSKVSDNERSRRETQALLRSDFGEKDIPELLELLAHDDMRIRLKAQFGLVREGEEGGNALVQASQPGQHEMKRIHAVWGLGQLSRQDLVFARHLHPLLSDDQAEVRAQAAKVLGDVRDGEAAMSLLPLLQDDHPRVRFFAAQALGRLAEKSAVRPLIDMLAENDGQDAYLRHAGALALAQIGDAQALMDLADHANRSVRLAAVVALRRMRHRGVSDFLADKEEAVVTEAARAINDDWSIEESLPDLADYLTTTTFQNEALLRRAISANSRVGTPKTIQNLIAFADDQTRPLAMRVEAISTLGVWAKPSVFDRVDGRYRGEVERPIATLHGLAEESFKAWLRDPDEAIRTTAAVAARKAMLKGTAEVLYAGFKQDRNAAFRAQALRSLATLQVANLEDALQAALVDREKDVRVAALDLILEVDLPGPTVVSMLQDAMRTAEPDEQQSVLRALGQLPKDQTVEAVRGLMGQLLDGKQDAAVYLELLQLGIDQGLDEAVANFRAQFAERGAVADYIECLEGGDADRGRDVLISNSNAQCLKCHAIRGYGGVAGPPLDDVGARVTKEYMLASMIDPNADITPGYGVVTLTLNDDRFVSGIALAETENELVVRNSDEEEITIQKSDIRERIDALSSMPTMVGVLSKEEMRDLLSFLVQLQGQAL